MAAACQGIQILLEEPQHLGCLGRPSSQFRNLGLTEAVGVPEGEDDSFLHGIVSLQEEGLGPTPGWNRRRLLSVNRLSLVAIPVHKRAAPVAKVSRHSATVWQEYNNNLPLAAGFNAMPVSVAQGASPSG